MAVVAVVVVVEEEEDGMGKADVDSTLELDFQYVMEKRLWE